MYLTITIRQVTQCLYVGKIQFGAAKIFRSAIRGDFNFSGVFLISYKWQKSRYLSLDQIFCDKTKTLATTFCSSSH